MSKKTIEEQIAADAYAKWTYGDEPKSIEDAIKTTGNSEVAAIEGIVARLGLEEDIIDKLIGPRIKEEEKERDKIGEIYVQSAMSPEIVSKIQEAMKKGDKDKIVLDILSTIHDNWVKNNANNFLKEGRNREFQFVPLELLSWKEVESDLVFLKPILEAAGIEVDREQLKQEFEIRQKNFLIDNSIYSKEDLKDKLSQGSKFYPALKDLETVNGGNIEQLLKNDANLESMAIQIGEQVPIKSREELALEVIRAENPKYNNLLWIETTTYEFNGGPKLSEPISMREILLSKLIGQPYPTYILSGITNYNHDTYKNTIRSTYGHEYVMDLVDRSQSERIEQAKTIEEGKKGRIKFGNTCRDGISKMPGSIIVTDKELLEHGIAPEKVGWEEITKEKIAEKKTVYKKLKKELRRLKRSGEILGASKKYEIEILEGEIEEIKAEILQAEADYKEYIVTPKDMARAAKKRDISRSEVYKGGEIVKGTITKEVVPGKDEE